MNLDRLTILGHGMDICRDCFIHQQQTLSRVSDLGEEAVAVAVAGVISLLQMVEINFLSLSSTDDLPAYGSVSGRTTASSLSATYSNLMNFLDDATAQSAAAPPHSARLSEHRDDVSSISTLSPSLAEGSRSHRVCLGRRWASAMMLHPQPSSSLQSPPPIAGWAQLLLLLSPPLRTRAL
jgi:hypothetical protein